MSLRMRPEDPPPMKRWGIRELSSGLEYFLHPLRRERQMPQPLAGQPIEGIGDRASDERIADLAKAGGTCIHIDELHRHLFRQIRHAHQVVVVEVRLLDPAVLDGDAL